VRDSGTEDEEPENDRTVVPTGVAHHAILASAWWMRTWRPSFLRQ
jgi:hypothetical protein